MSWLDDIGAEAGKNFAADKVLLGAVVVGAVAIGVGVVWWLLGRLGAVDPIFGCEKCKAAKVDLVLVEFADREGSLAAFGGVRSQYVNLGRYGVGDPQVTTFYQTDRRPQIVVKVSPPMALPVTLRLVREERGHGFPGGSDTLSVREQAIEHLGWDPARTATVQTDASGDGMMNPGMVLPQTAGYQYRVEGSVNGKPFLRSSNAVSIKRRIAIRPLVRHAAGQAAAFAAISDIGADLAPLDLDLFMLPTETGSELGVQEKESLATPLAQLGCDALNSPDTVKAFNPYAVAIIVGEFVVDKIVPQTYEVELDRGADGRFDSRVAIGLTVAGTQHQLVPLADKSQFVAASIRHGSPPTTTALLASEVSDLTQFVKQVSVDLSRVLPAVPSSVSRLAVSVKLKTVDSWAIGWAFDKLPVIYLNMRDPRTNAILSPEQAAALVIHELGHKLHLTSTGGAGEPDQPPHHYPSFTNKEGRSHRGPHCSTGVPDGVDVWTDEAEAAATCNMWGALLGTRVYCAECRTTLRKVNLAPGF